MWSVCFLMILISSEIVTVLTIERINPLDIVAQGYKRMQELNSTSRIGRHDFNMQSELITQLHNHLAVYRELTLIKQNETVANLNNANNTNTSSIYLNGVYNILASRIRNIDCSAQHLNFSVALIVNRTSFCAPKYDGALCWSPTQANRKAIQHCPRKYQNKDYDHTKKASLDCTAEGVWSIRANYLSCALNKQNTMAAFCVYTIGYSISFICLLISIFIFLHFRTLLCLRNIIHCHLIASFILKVIVWFLITVTGTAHIMICNCLSSLYQFATLANFSWMLIEGLYLFIVIVWTFGAQRVKAWYLVLGGWGVPLLFALAWTSVKATNFGFEKCWIKDEFKLDLVVIVPILIILAVNLIFLFGIMYTVISKLQQTRQLSASVAMNQGDAESQAHIAKAAKSTILLFPLLGLTYLIYIVPYGNNLEVFGIVNAFFNSTQGFWVSLFYCFLNGEVRNVLKLRRRALTSSRNGTLKKSKANTRLQRNFIATDTTLLPAINNECAIELKSSIYGNGKNYTNSSVVEHGAVKDVKSIASPLSEDGVSNVYTEPLLSSRNDSDNHIDCQTFNNTPAEAPYIGNM